MQGDGSGPLAKGGTEVKMAPVGALPAAVPLKGGHCDEAQSEDESLPDIDSGEEEDDKDGMDASVDGSGE
jgi:hypothetical protein